MKGVGTNDQRLVRVIVTQKDRHLRPIAARFLEKFKATIKVWVCEDTSGDYRKLLETVLDHFANLN